MPQVGLLSERARVHTAPPTAEEAERISQIMAQIRRSIRDERAARALEQPRKAA